MRLSNPTEGLAEFYNTAVQSTAQFPRLHAGSKRAYRVIDSIVDPLCIAGLFVTGLCFTSSAWGAELGKSWQRLGIGLLLAGTCTNTISKVVGDVVRAGGPRFRERLPEHSKLTLTAVAKDWKEFADGQSSAFKLLASITSPKAFGEVGVGDIPGAEYLYKSVVTQENFREAILATEEDPEAQKLAVIKADLLGALCDKLECTDPQVTEILARLAETRQTTLDSVSTDEMGMFDYWLAFSSDKERQAKETYSIDPCLFFLICSRPEILTWSRVLTPEKLVHVIQKNRPARANCLFKDVADSTALALASKAREGSEEATAQFFKHNIGVDYWNLRNPNYILASSGRSAPKVLCEALKFTYAMGSEQDKAELMRVIKNEEGKDE